MQGLRERRAAVYSNCLVAVNVEILAVSRLFRNVPIVNYLEMSPSWGLMLSLECALKRSPAF